MQYFHPGATTKEQERCVPLSVLFKVIWLSCLSLKRNEIIGKSQLSCFMFLNCLHQINQQWFGDRPRKAHLMRAEGSRESDSEITSDVCQGNTRDLPHELTKDRSVSPHCPSDSMHENVCLTESVTSRWVWVQCSTNVQGQNCLLLLCNFT